MHFKPCRTVACCIAMNDDSSDLCGPQHTVDKLQLLQAVIVGIQHVTVRIGCEVRLRIAFTGDDSGATQGREPTSSDGPLVGDGKDAQAVVDGVIVPTGVNS